MQGGGINTDAIDNSAGVDCSDHEVNIKIALQAAVQNKKITMKQRNTLLASMTDSVAELVLNDNHLQTLALSVEEHQGSVLNEAMLRLIRRLSDEELLDPVIEYLPNEEEIMDRQARHVGPFAA